MSIPWDRVISLSLDNNPRLDNEIEEIYPLLSNVDLDNSLETAEKKDIIKLCKVFKATADMKSVFLDEADEELSMAEKEIAELKVKVTGNAKMFSPTNLNQKQMEELYRNELVALEEELKESQMQIQILSGELQEYKIRLESQTEFKHLQEEIENLSRQNKYLTRDIQVIEENLATERKSNEVLSKELQDEKNRGMEREQELVRFRMETKELRDLMEKLKDQVTARRNEEGEFRTTLREKNRVIDQYIKEIQDLAAKYQQSVSQNETLTREYKILASEIEKLTSEKNEAQKSLQENDSLIDKLHMEKEALRIQYDEAVNRLAEQENVDETTFDQIQNQIEQWMSNLRDRDFIITEKNELIDRMKNDISSLKKQVRELDPETITQLLQEKDQTIEQLRENLALAYQDFELLNMNYDDLTTILQKGEDLFQEKENDQNQEEQPKVENASENIIVKQLLQREKDRFAALADEAMAKDRDLVQLRAKLESISTGIYGLPEALSEIRNITEQLSIRDKDILDKTKSINVLQREIDEILEENEILRENLSPDSDLTIKKRGRSLEMERLKAINYQLSNEIEKLEEERLELKSRLRLSAVDKANFAITLGLSADDLVALEDYANQLKKGDKEPISTVKSSTIQPMIPNIDHSILMKDLEKAYHDLAISRRDLKMLKESKDDVKSENKRMKTVIRNLAKSILDIKRSQNFELDVKSIEKLYKVIEKSLQDGGESILRSTETLNSKLEDLTKENSSLKDQLEKLKEAESNNQVLTSNMNSILQQMQQYYMMLLQHQGMRQSQENSEDYQDEEELEEVEASDIQEELETRESTQVPVIPEETIASPNLDINKDETFANPHRDIVLPEEKTKSNISLQHTDTNKSGSLTSILKQKASKSGSKVDISNLAEEPSIKGHARIASISESQHEDNVEFSIEQNQEREGPLKYESLTSLHAGQKGANSQTESQRGTSPPVSPALQSMGGSSVSINGKPAKENAKIKRKGEEKSKLKFGNIGMVPTIPFPYPQIQYIPNPTSTSTSTDLNAANELLKELMQELEEKDSELAKCKECLQSYDMTLTSKINQISYVYHEYEKLNQEFQESKKEMLEEIRSLSLENTKNRALVDNLTAAMTSNADSDTVARSLELATIKAKAEFHARELLLANQRLEDATNELQNTKNELRDLDNISYNQISKLYKELAIMKSTVSDLECQLDSSIPHSEMERIQKQLNDVTRENHSLLSKLSSDIYNKVDSESLKERITELTEVNQELSMTNKILEEQSQALLEENSKINSINFNPEVATLKHDLSYAKTQINLLEQKLARSDAKSKNQFLSDRQQQAQIKSLEDQVDQLHREKVELELQLNDTALKLSMSTPPHLILGQSKIIRDQEITIASMRSELENLKRLLSTSRQQNQDLLDFRENSESEIKRLSMAIKRMETGSEERVMISQLMDQLRKENENLTNTNHKISKLEDKCHSLEEALLMAEKSNHALESRYASQRASSKTRINHMLRTIKRLRSQYEGLTSKDHHGKLLQVIEKQKLDFNEVKKELQSIKMINLELTDNVEKFEEELRGKDQVIQAMSHTSAIDKISQWSSKLTNLRTENRKLCRQIRDLDNEKGALEKKLNELNIELLSTDSNLTKLQEEYETSQVNWETRETELELLLQRYEDEKAKLLLSAKDDESGAEQDNLGIALSSIIERAKSSSLDQLEELRAKIKVLQKEILAKDKTITQLELSHPLKDTPLKSNYEDPNRAMQMLKMATDTIHALQGQLRSKEESLVKYQDMLQASRQEAVKQRELDKKVLNEIHQKFSEQTQQLIARLIQLQEEQQVLTKIPQSTLTEPKDPNLSHMTFETVIQDLKIKDYENETLKIHISALQNELSIIKSKHKLAMEINNESSQSQENLFQELGETRDIIAFKDQEIERLRKELDLLNENLLNNFPGKILRDTVIKLKTQLRQKDDELGRLYQSFEAVKENYPAEEIKRLLEQVPSISEYKTIKEKAQNASKELAKLKEEKTTLESNVTSLENESNRKSLQLSSQSMRIIKMQKQTRDLQDQVSQLKAQIIDANQKTEKDTRDDHRDTIQKQLQNEYAKAKWEADKMWKKKMETLMSKTQDKTRSLEIREQELILAKEIISKLEKEKYELEDRLKKQSKDDEKDKSRGTYGIDSLKRKVDHLERENGRLLKIIEQSESLSSHVKLEHEISRLKKETKKSENKDVQAIEDQVKMLQMKLLDKEATINNMTPKINKLKELEQKNENLQEEIEKWKSQVKKLSVEGDQIEFYKQKVSELEKKSHASGNPDFEDELKRKINRYEEANKILLQEVQVIKESYAQLKSQNQELLQNQTKKDT